MITSPSCITHSFCFEEPFDMRDSERDEMRKIVFFPLYLPKTHRDTETKAPPPTNEVLRGLLWEVADNGNVRKT